MMFRRLLVAGAAVAIGAAAAATGASAYSISGGVYAATSTSGHSANVAGGYTVVCPPPMFSGVATGAATTSFTPGDAICDYFGLPANYSFDGPWDLTVAAGPDVGGWYTARVDIPLGSTVTVDVPLAGCSVVNSGPLSFAHGVSGNVIRLRNVTGGVQAEASVNGIAYTASGCPFSSGSDGSYNTNGYVDFPGVTIS